MLNTRFRFVLSQHNKGDFVVEKAGFCHYAAYNCAEYIGDSIRSVQAQTYTDWELIIADDNSKDDTVRIVKKFADADSRIVLIESQENLGPAGARNKAIEAASGTYMAFLDSDDICTPKSLKGRRHLWRKTDMIFPSRHMKKLMKTGKSSEFWSERLKRSTITDFSISATR